MKQRWQGRDLHAQGLQTQCLGTRCVKWARWRALRCVSLGGYGLDGGWPHALCSLVGLTWILITKIVTLTGIKRIKTLKSPLGNCCIQHCLCAAFSEVDLWEQHCRCGLLLDWKDGSADPSRVRSQLHHRDWATRPGAFKKRHTSPPSATTTTNKVWEMKAIQV